MDQSYSCDRRYKEISYKFNKKFFTKPHLLFNFLCVLNQWLLSFHFGAGAFYHLFHMLCICPLLELYQFFIKKNIVQAAQSFFSLNCFKLKEIYAVTEQEMICLRKFTFFCNIIKNFWNKIRNIILQMFYIHKMIFL